MFKGRRGLHRSNNNKFRHSEVTDKNEKYVKRTSAQYLKRILMHDQSLDRNTLEFAFSILGSKADDVKDSLMTQLTGLTQGEFKEDIQDADDYDDYARAVIKSLQKSKKKTYDYALKKVLGALELRRQALLYRGLSDIEKTVRSFMKMFDLTEREGELCAFLYSAHASNEIENYFIDHLECNSFLKRNYLEVIFQCSRKEIRQLFSGNMARLDMIENSYRSFKLKEDYLEFFEQAEGRVEQRKLYRKITGKVLPLHYHLIDPEQTAHVIKLLQSETKNSNNILLYGPPGTGKTTFAKGLAKQTCTTTYEVVQGTENDGGTRRAAILACLNMTDSDPNAVVVIDEADSILNTKSSWFERGETQDKGWLNQLLEKQGVKTIWITNHIDRIETSVLRRFAFSIYFKPFNRRQRIQLWRNIIQKNRVKRFFAEIDIELFAGRYKVNAGAIDLALQKAIEVQAVNKKVFNKTVELALDSHLILMNSGEKPTNKDEIEQNYSLAGLNIQADLDAIILQLEQFDIFLRQNQKDRIMNLNLLFYGVPGAGKSELARYIAGHLDRELITKRLSDIIDPYVGMTERNISQSFAEAEAEEAVLVIDEADSLLFSRDAAVRSWEISFTNEFLTQMERFRGILICTTNRFDGLDTASLRRFNHKVGFDFLTAEGNQIFYEKMLAGLVRSAISQKEQERLLKISNLTPGDFRVVRDRYAFYPKEETHHSLFIEDLQNESRIKLNHNKQKVIGF